MVIRTRSRFFRHHEFQAPTQNRPGGRQCDTPRYQDMDQDGYLVRFMTCPLLNIRGVYGTIVDENRGKGSEGPLLKARITNTDAGRFTKHTAAIEQHTCVSDLRYGSFSGRGFRYRGTCSLSISVGEASDHGLRSLGCRTVISKRRPE